MAKLATILLAFDDVGMAVQLQENLEAAGYTVTWSAAAAAGPTAGDDLPDVVILSDVHADLPLNEMVAGWREADVPPGIIVMAGAEEANRLRVARLDSGISGVELTSLIERTAKLRHAGGLDAPYPALVALNALGLATSPGDAENAIRIVTNAHKADTEMVRAALRWHAQDYVAIAAGGIEILRSHRALQIPEIEFVKLADGTRTLQTLLKSGTVDPWHAARLTWALASIATASFSPEPPDQSSRERRALTQARFHLRARHQRLADATFYDVLEVTPDASRKQVDDAARMLSLRYGPRHLADLDLATLGAVVTPLWEQIKEAHAALADAVTREKYNRWLAKHKRTSEWMVGVIAVRSAADALERGQRALVEGEVYKAVSETAAACRHQSGHPDYEASLAYARYRADVQGGKDRGEIARRERANAKQALAGRRPWPHALVALGILCAADEDAPAARWHLREALTCNPNLPAAQQLLQRLR